MGGALSRNKGARFERAVAQRLNKLALLSAEWARNVEESQQGVAGDVKDLNQVWPITIQAKHRKQVSALGALQEAEDGAMRYPGDDKPHAVAWIRKHGGEEFVVMRPYFFMMSLLAMDEVAYDDQVSVDNTFERLYKLYTDIISM